MKQHWLLFVSVFAAALLLHAPRLNRPFAPDIASAAATYQILFARNWDEAGFAELRGVPCVGQPSGGVAERAPYLHHPVLSYWIAYALRCTFGWHEWVFRLLPFVGLVIAALLVTAVGLRVLGAIGAFLAGCCFLLSPGVFRYGDMPNPESLVLCFLLAGWLLHERIRENPTRARKLVFFAVAFCGMLVDWQVFFLAPTLLLGEALRPAAQRRWREALLALWCCLAALLLTLAHFTWGTGSIEFLGTELASTMQRTLGGRGTGFLAFITAQGRSLVHCMGVGLLLAGALLLGLVLTGRASGERSRAAVALALPALLSVLCFRGPALDHAFWWMPASAFFALAGGWLLVKLLHVRALLGALACALLLGSLALDSRAGERHLGMPKGWYQDVAALVDRFAQPGDVVLTPDPFGPALFYTRTRVYENINTPQQLLLVQQRVRSGRVHMFMLLTTAPAHRELCAWLDAHAHRTPHPGVLHWTL